METILKVTMSFDSSCNLLATDDSAYSTLTDVNKHAIVEFITDKTNENQFQRLHFITGQTDPKLKVSDTIDLQKDGTYTYYRMIVPTLSELLHNGVYEAEDKYFAHEDAIYFSTQDFTVFDKTASYIREVEDCIEIWENKDANYLYWFNIKLFSICKLNNCITYKINKWLIGKKNSAGCKKTNDVNLDFLMEASFALKYLVEQNRFDDAQRTLDSLTSCGTLCSETEVSTNCNCRNNVQ